MASEVFGWIRYSAELRGDRTIYESGERSDHRRAAEFCIDSIRRQKAKASCYSYEIFAPFHSPTHFIDITAIEEEKRKLIRFHEDQNEQEEINLSLNAFRAAQLIKHKIYVLRRRLSKWM